MVKEEVPRLFPEWHWQPYPSHPRVRVLTERIAGAQAKIEEALDAGEWPRARALAGDREIIARQLGLVTEALLHDPTLVPRWVEHTDADSEHGAIPCLECWNNIPAGEVVCSYCGWTYLVDSSGDDLA